VSLQHQRSPGLTTSVNLHLIPDDQAEDHDGQGCTCSDKPESTSGQVISTIEERARRFRRRVLALTSVSEHT